MKKGWKRFWITSGAIAGIGVLFLILGFILGVSFSKIKFGFPYIFPLSNRVVTVKKHRADRRRKNVRRGKKSGNGCGSYECISEAFPKWKSMCGH